MKKILSTLVFVFFTYCFYGQTTFEVGGIKYTTISATKVKVDSKNPKYSGDLTIPSTVTFTTNTYDVTSIGNEAFNGCIELTSITIPMSVTNIGKWSFQGCSNLTSIIIPNSVITIGYATFQSCSNLTSITIPNSVMSIESAAFNETKWYNNKPNGVIYAGKVLYNYKGSMPSNTTLSVLEGTISIANDAFFGLSGLTSINIPNSVINIGTYAFNECTNLTSITIPNTVTSVGSNAFKNTKWYNDKPDGVVYVGKVLYRYKGNVPSNTNITAIEGTVEIASGAFECGYSDNSISSINIPNSVKSIGGYAFYGCKNLTSIDIPNSVTSIGDKAFASTAIKSIILPKCIVGHSVIEACSNLTKVVGHADLLNNIGIFASPVDSITLNMGELYDEGIQNIKSRILKLTFLDLSETENKEIAEQSFYNFFKLDSLQLPNNLEKIKYREFSECISLKNINIPTSVTEIGMRAFENCRSLKSVNFESNSQLKTINNWAFYACHGLQNITIPNGVTTVGDGAFWGCEYLSDLTLPSTVQKINDNGFDGCIGLGKIKVEATIPPIVSAKTFNRVNKNAAIYVPDASVSMYKNAFGWKDFFNIKGISTQVQELNEPSFAICVINKTIEITNAEGEAVELFDVAGRMIFKKSNADNQQTISLQQKGVYLLKIGDFKKKIMID